MSKNINRLDPFSKILLATQTINFIAANISDLMTANAFIGTEMSNSIAAEHREYLSKIVDALKPIMEDMGEFVNGRDAVSPIDVRITRAAFDIVVGGKDNTEK